MCVHFLHFCSRPQKSKSPTDKGIDMCRPVCKVLTRLYESVLHPNVCFTSMFKWLISPSNCDEKLTKINLGKSIITKFNIISLKETQARPCICSKQSAKSTVCDLIEWIILMRWHLISPLCPVSLVARQSAQAPNCLPGLDRRARGGINDFLPEFLLNFSSSLMKYKQWKWLTSLRKVSMRFLIVRNFTCHEWWMWLFNKLYQSII